MLNFAGASAVNSILSLCGHKGGNFFASLSEKSATCHLNSSGNLISSFACCSAYLCAISIVV